MSERESSGGLAVILIAVVLLGLTIPCVLGIGIAAFWWLLARSETPDVAPAPRVAVIQPSDPTETLAVVREIAAAQMGVDVAEIQPSTSLGELKADELDLVELVMELEDHFGIVIPDESIVEVTGSATWVDGRERLTMLKLVEIVEGQRLDPASR